MLRAERGRRRLRLADDQRRRLAVKGKALGRRRLEDIAGIECEPGRLLGGVAFPETVVAPTGFEPVFQP